MKKDKKGANNKKLRVYNAKLGLGDKIFLGFVLIAIVFVLIAIGVNFHYYKISQCKDVQVSMEKMSTNQKIQLEEYINDKITILQYMVTFPEIYEMDREEQKEFIEERCTMLGFHHMFVMDTQGNGYYIDENVVRDQSREPFFKNVMENEVYVTEPFYGVDRFKAIITVCVSIYDEAGEKTGVLCGAIDLTEIQQLIEKNEIVLNGECMIVNRTGEYIMTENIDNVYGRKSIYSMEDSEISLIESAFEDQQDKIGTIILDGKEYQAYVAYAGNYDWAIIQCVQTDIILEDGQSVIRWQYGLAFLVIGLALATFRIIYCWMVSDREINIDALTKCNSRAACDTLLNRLEEKRTEEIVVVYMDLNNFKQVNDTYGHEKGDELLCIFSEVLKEILEETGFVGRMGGDEFISILLDKTEFEIRTLCKQIETLLEERSKMLDIPYDITMSYGYAFRHKGSKETLNAVLQKADEAMYQQKQESKKSRAVTGFDV